MDAVMFLKMVREKWDTGKQIYELNGPNRRNWEMILETSLPDDSQGNIMSEVFKLLSSTEVQGASNDNSLFIPLIHVGGLMGMTMYFQSGPLSKDNVQVAVKAGRGGVAWLDAVDIAYCAVNTIEFLMSRISSLQSHPLLQVEIISSRIETLLGEECMSGDFLEELDDSSGLMQNARRLRTSLKKMNDVHQASIKTKIQAAQLKAEKDEYQHDLHRVIRQRTRAGITFEDDSREDVRYLVKHVAPTACEMVSSPPISLPQNHVERELPSDSDVFNADRFQSPPEFPYRSVHHYLNTHFTLGREDCLAQMRRGVASLRECLGMIDEEKTVPVPSANKLRESCLKFAGNRNNDNGGAYVYGEVVVRDVDRMHESVGYVLDFSLYDKRKVDWNNSRRFMVGSLLCLSKNGTFNEDSIVMATVLRGVQPQKGTQVFSVTGATAAAAHQAVSN